MPKTTQIHQKINFIVFFFFAIVFGFFKKKSKKQRVKNWVITFKVPLNILIISEEESLLIIAY